MTTIDKHKLSRLHIMVLLSNPLRHTGLLPQPGITQARVSDDPTAAQDLLLQCPKAAPTPLRVLPALAEALNVGSLHLKDERGRMGLGSFKALGAAYAIARQAAERTEARGGPMEESLAGRVYACASAGNHGLSVAAGARLFGARAIIYLSNAIPEAFAERLRRLGAQVVRSGRDYDASMAAAARDAEENGWILLSDSSWPGYVELPLRVMEGYLVAGAEASEQLAEPPSHIMLQAGVGGFAAAMTALFRARWGDRPTIVVVEPTAAPALINSIRAGKPVRATGPASTMGRLDCKAPSHLALAELACEADFFVTIDDDECAATVSLLERFGIATTPSGAAGVSAVQHADGHRGTLGVDEHSRVLAFVTEGREDAA